MNPKYRLPYQALVYVSNHHHECNHHDIDDRMNNIDDHDDDYDNYSRPLTALEASSVEELLSTRVQNAFRPFEIMPAKASEHKS